MSETYDFVVVGGGPGGSTAASVLAARGARVALFERDTFPRFHIGESLLPFNMDIFERLGIVDRLRREFIEKWGAEFISGDGRVRQVFHFEDGLIPGRPMCFQVLRERFDQLLLEAAAERGARVFQGQTVLEVSPDRRRGVDLRVRDGAGAERRVQAQLLLDASGRDGLFSGRVRRQWMDPQLRKAAVFAHYENVPRAGGRDGGNIILVLLRDAWFWFIPLAGGRTSVGLVLDGRRQAECGLRPQELFDSAAAACPAASDLLRRGRRVSPVRATSDWSYQCRRVRGDRHLLVGDAAGFVDPIFSSGVYLAMTSGEMAAQAALLALERGDFSRGAFRQYARTVRRNYGRYRRLARRFYRPGFTEVCLAPATRFRLTPAVISLLAGCLDGGWALRWRLAWFYAVARLQRRLALAPRLDLPLVLRPVEAAPAARRRSAGAA